MLTKYSAAVVHDTAIKLRGTVWRICLHGKFSALVCAHGTYFVIVWNSKKENWCHRRFSYNYG